MQAPEIAEIYVQRGPGGGASAAAPKGGIVDGVHIRPGQARSPRAHWLEWVDWAEPLVEEPLAIVDGFAVVPDSPGNGLVWNASAGDKFRMRDPVILMVRSRA